MWLTLLIIMIYVITLFCNVDPLKVYLDTASPICQSQLYFQEGLSEALDLNIE
jgi:hypothetical protein